MSGVVTPAALKAIKARNQTIIAQVSTEHCVFKELDGKKSNPLVKKFVESNKLGGKTRVLSNLKDSKQFFKLAQDIQKFAEEHEDIDYIDSAIDIPKDERMNERSDELYQRKAMLKKIYDFVQLLVRYGSATVCNSKADKEEKAEKTEKKKAPKKETKPKAR